MAVNEYDTYEPGHTDELNTLLESRNKPHIEDTEAYEEFKKTVEQGVQDANQMKFWIENGLKFAKSIAKLMLK